MWENFGRGERCVCVYMCMYVYIDIALESQLLSESEAIDRSINRSINRFSKILFLSSLRSLVEVTTLFDLEGSIIMLMHSRSGSWV